MNRKTIMETSEPTNPPEEKKTRKELPMKGAYYDYDKIHMLQEVYGPHCLETPSDSYLPERSQLVTGREQEKSNGIWWAIRRHLETTLQQYVIPYPTYPLLTSHCWTINLRQPDKTSADLWTTLPELLAYLKTFLLATYNEAKIVAIAVEQGTERLLIGPSGQTLQLSKHTDQYVAIWTKYWMIPHIHATCIFPATQLLRDKTVLPGDLMNYLNHELQDKYNWIDDILVTDSHAGKRKRGSSWDVRDQLAYLTKQATHTLRRALATHYGTPWTLFIYDNIGLHLQQVLDRYEADHVQMEEHEDPVQLTLLPSTAPPKLTNEIAIQQTVDYLMTNSYGLFSGYLYKLDLNYAKKLCPIRDLFTVIQPPRALKDSLLAHKEVITRAVDSGCYKELEPERITRDIRFLDGIYSLEDGQLHNFDEYKDTKTWILAKIDRIFCRSDIPEMPLIIQNLALHQNIDPNSLLAALGSLLFDRKPQISRAIYIYGPPSSGKTFCLTWLKTLYGDNIRSLAHEDRFMFQDANDILTFWFEEWCGKTMSPALLKEFLFAEQITTAAKYRGQRLIKLRGRVAFTTNEPPPDDEALTRRMITIEFPNKIQNPDVSLWAQQQEQAYMIAIAAAAAFKASHLD